MDNEHFADFLCQNWNEKFKAATVTSLEQLHHQQQLQKLSINASTGNTTTFSSTATACSSSGNNANRQFLDELQSLRYQQQLQLQQQQQNTRSMADVKDIRFAMAPSSALHSNATVSSPNRNTASGSLSNRGDVKDIRLINLVSPSSTLRLPEDTTISRSNLPPSAQQQQQHSIGTVTPSQNTFNSICSTIQQHQHHNHQELADSTTPPPSIASSSSSVTSLSSVLAAVPGSEHEKKAANSIRGTHWFCKFEVFFYKIENASKNARSMKSFP